jgi:NAD(P)H-nitrite reductase large subunit
MKKGAKMKQGNDQMVCYCKQVNRGRIIQAIADGASTLKQIQKATGAGTGKRCKELNPKGVCCIPDIQAILKAETGREEQTQSCCSHCRSGK